MFTNGISMFMLVKRARICGIINESIEKRFYIAASKAGWRKNEPNWDIEEVEPQLFNQLVYRAVRFNAFRGICDITSTTCMTSSSLFRMRLFFGRLFKIYVVIIYVRTSI